MQDLLATYERAANPAECFSALQNAVAEQFGQLSKADAVQLAAAFLNRPEKSIRSKPQAVRDVTKRIVDRLESAKRCQF